MESVYSNARNEVPLITFTVLVPISWGMTLFGFVSIDNAAVSIAALSLAVVGTLASILHLAKPLRAPLSITHFKTSWLSREIIAASAFDAFLACWVLFNLLNGYSAFATVSEICAVLVGIVLLYAMAVAYRVRPRPAWNGPESLIELIACGMGGGVTAVATVLAVQGLTWPIMLVLIPFIDAVMCFFAIRKRECRLEENEHNSAHATRERVKDLQKLTNAVLGLKVCAIVLFTGATFVGGAICISLIICSAILELASSISIRINFYCMAVPIPHVVKLRRVH